MEIALGSKVKDSISGFSGIVTGIVDYITGCKQALVQPQIVDKEDKKTPEWFDVDRLETLEAKPIRLPRHTANGADKAAPVR